MFLGILVLSQEAIPILKKNDTHSIYRSKNAGAESKFQNGMNNKNFASYTSTVQLWEDIPIKPKIYHDYLGKRTNLSIWNDLWAPRKMEQVAREKRV